MPDQLVWLVTGCSSGFGVEFVKAILARGDMAIATARDIDSLRPLAELGAATMQLDVAVPAEQIDTKVKAAVDVYGRVDVLVANAGQAQYGAIKELPEDLLLAQFRLNTLSTLHLLQALMPYWRSQKSGYLVVNSSQDSIWHTFPGFGAYAASKAALDRLVQLFAAETANLEYIKTLTIHPGSFRTEATAAKKHNFERPKLARPDDGATKYAHLNAMFAELAPAMHSKQSGDPAKLAKIVVDVVKGEGVAEGRSVPRFLPFGKDAIAEAKQYAELVLKVCGEWEAVVGSTDFDE